MTAQVPDHLFYEDEQYAIVGVDGSGLLTPADFGLEPVMMSTACWRGFIADYAVDGERLILSALTVRTVDDQYPPLKGIAARSGGVMGGMRYEDLNTPVAFSGGLLIGRDFIHETYVHMGFHKPSQFRHVLEITCEAGRVLGVQDRSEQSAAHRARQRFEHRLWAAARGEEPGQRVRNITQIDKPGLLKWIEQRFSLDYKRDDDSDADITSKN